jgi:transcription termination factor Rho
MSVLDRASLEASPLADLHAIAGELSLDGYRRLRKADLIDRIIARQEGSEPEPADDVEVMDAGPQAGGEKAPAQSEEDEGPEAGGGRRRRGRRGGRGRSRGSTEGAESEANGASADDAAPERVGPESSEEDTAGEEPAVAGVVELLPNGSGFVRVSPPEASDEDVYISAAQVKRCELVTGDRVVGPKRAPRRSERFASLIRVDEINGRPASELADGARYDDLPAAFPAERFRLGSEDPTLKAIEWLTPFGRGSRVTVVGGPRAGKSHALRALAQALAADEGIQLFSALAGVRPEEISEWSSGPVTPAGAVSFASSSDAQAHVVELVVDQARRLAARGADAVLLIDTLDGLPAGVGRKALAAARNIVDGGSLTVIATASQPVGGETTVIALDAALTSAARFPALDLLASGTMRADLLVGEAGAQAIADARAEVLG